MSSINSNFEAMFNKFEGVASSKTVVGDAIHIGDVIIVPLVDISFGLGAGSFEDSGNEAKGEKSSGGAGIGAGITPAAVLVIENGNVQLLNIKNQDSISKLINMAPGLISKLDIGSWFKKNDANNESEEKE